MADQLKDIFDKHLNSLNVSTRNKILDLVKDDPIFVPKFDVSIREQKVIAQERLKKICDLKTVSITDFLKDPENIFTTHEVVKLISFNLVGNDRWFISDEIHSSI